MKLTSSYHRCSYRSYRNGFLLLLVVNSALLIIYIVVYNKVGDKTEDVLMSTYGGYDKYTSAFSSGCPVGKVLYGKCKNTREKVVFVKTHQTPSSVPSAVLIRYGVKTSLNFALPKYDYSHIGWPKPFRTSDIMGHPGLHAYGINYDMIVHNMIFDRCYVMHTFDYYNYTYITLVSDPVEELKTMIATYELDKRLANQDLITANIRSALEKASSSSGVSRLKYGNITLTQNAMSVDLGYPPSQFNNDSAIEEFLSRLYVDFRLVMIGERLVESVVLMRRALCWKWENVIFLHNTSQTVQNVTLQPDLLHQYKQWSRVDMKIHEVFARNLRQRMLEEGPDLIHEIDAFNKALVLIAEFCARIKTEANSSLVVAGNTWSRQFAVTSEHCHNMTFTPEEWTPTLSKLIAAKLTKLPMRLIDL